MVIKIIGYIIFAFGLYCTFNVSKWNSFHFKYNSTLDCPLYFIKMPLLYWGISILLFIFSVLILDLKFFIILISFGLIMEVGSYYAKMKHIQRFVEHIMKNEGLNKKDAKRKAKLLRIGKNLYVKRFR